MYEFLSSSCLAFASSSNSCSRPQGLQDRSPVSTQALHGRGGWVNTRVALKPLEDKGFSEMQFRHLKRTANKNAQKNKPFFIAA